MALTFASGTAGAAELITNGGFETGDFTGWSANVQSGSDGNLFVQPNNGGASPLSGSAYQFNPAGGNYFALSDQGGPGSYSLIQSFTLTSAGSVTISFDFFANDQGGAIYNNGRDYTVSPNQNAVVDLLVGSASPFSDAPGDVVSVLYGPGADNLNGNPNPWVSYLSTLNLGAGTYQLRFAETDNQLFFQMGVDNVSVTTSVPEPSTWAMMALGFVGLGFAGWRSRAGDRAARSA